MPSTCRSEEDRVLAMFVRGQEFGKNLSACSEAKLSHEAINHKILYPLSFSLVSMDSVEASWRRWAVKNILVSEHDATLCAEATKKTLVILETVNIYPVVIKGASLAFGNPRDAGDVDLLIHESCLLEVIRCLESKGYLYRGFERNIHIRPCEHRNWKRLLRWANQFEFTEPDTGVLVEVHTSFFETGRLYEEKLAGLRSSIKEFLSSAVLDEKTNFKFLSLEDRVLLLAMHCGLKRSPSRKSFILRQLLDFRSLMEHGFDWDRLEARAFHFKVAQHVLILLRFYEVWVGDTTLQHYIIRYESRLPWLMVKLQNIHSRCLTPDGSYDSLAILAYRILAPYISKGTFSAKIKSLLVFPLFFPEPYEIAEMYGLSVRSRMVFLCYLIEPLRIVFRLVSKLIKMSAAQNCTRLPSFLARDRAIRNIPSPSGKAQSENATR